MMLYFGLLLGWAWVLGFELSTCLWVCLGLWMVCCGWLGLDWFESNGCGWGWLNCALFLFYVLFYVFCEVFGFWIVCMRME